MNSLPAGRGPHAYGLFWLTELDREAFQSHLLSLDSAARRLRFGMSVNDAALLSLAERLPLEDGSLGLFIWGELKGCVQVLSLKTPGHAELAVSLSPDMRGRGWGAILVRAALERALDRRVSKVDILYVRENSAMHRIAVRFPGPSESWASDVCKQVDLAQVDFDGLPRLEHQLLSHA